MKMFQPWNVEYSQPLVPWDIQALDMWLEQVKTLLCPTVIYPHCLPAAEAWVWDFVHLAFAIHAAGHLPCLNTEYILFPQL